MPKAADGAPERPGRLRAHPLHRSLFRPTARRPVLQSPDLGTFPVGVAPVGVFRFASGGLADGARFDRTRDRSVTIRVQ